MTLNKTRKNLRDKISNKKNQCNTYSEGFIRRMTDDITFVKYIGPQKEHDRITEKFKKLKEQLGYKNNESTEDKIDNFIENFDKRHNEYLESVKNGTNIY